MPGVDVKDKNSCGPTHHFACRCREMRFKKIEDALQRIVSGLEKGIAVVPLSFAHLQGREALGKGENEPHSPG